MTLMYVCVRNLKWGIKCEVCGLWCHCSCGSVKAQLPEERIGIVVNVELKR